MTKADIIEEIVASTGVARKDAATTVEAFMEAIKTVCWRERKMFT